MSTAAPSKPIPQFREPLLLGSWLDFMEDRLGLLLRVAKECGEVGRFRLGPLPMYAVTGPALLTSLLIEHGGRTHTDPFMKSAWPVLGRTGLPMVSGEYHRRLRRIMAPAFTPKRLTAYGKDIVGLADQFQRSLGEGASIDISRDMQKLVRDILVKSIFALPMKENDAFFESVFVVGKYISDGVANPVRPPLSVPTPYNLKARAAVKRLRERSRILLEQARQRGTDMGDVLSMLIMSKDEDGTGLSEDELLEQVLLLYLSGFETTANTLTFTWWLLAKHSEVQARVQAELDAVLGGRAPTPEDLPKLPYLLQVIKESMRIYPGGAFYGRAPLEDMEIMGYRFPRDAFLVISPYVVHRNPEYFPDPERFLPERFLPENEKKLPRSAYIPFGVGPKVCIGQHLAMLEVQLVLAQMCQHMTASLPPNTPEIGALPLAVLTPTRFQLTMTRRKPVLAMVS